MALVFSGGSGIIPGCFLLYDFDLFLRVRGLVPAQFFESCWFRLLHRRFRIKLVTFKGFRTFFVLVLRALQTKSSLWLSNHTVTEQSNSGSFECLSPTVVVNILILVISFHGVSRSI